MPGTDNIGAWIEGLKSFRTRASARKELERCGPAVADQVLPLITDGSLPENTRWAAIMVVKAWRYAPAAPLLVEVLRTHAGLRGVALQGLEDLTGFAIGDAPDEWDRALADPEAYRQGHQGPAPLAAVDTSGEPDGCRIFRQALANVATEVSWDPEGFLYLRIPLEGGRKQQVLVTFSDVDSGGKPLATLYTECGELRAESLDNINRRNVTARYGKFHLQKEEQGPEQVIMRETVPLQRLTSKLARDIVQTMAAEADALEQEMSGEDHI